MVRIDVTDGLQVTVALEESEHFVHTLIYLPMWVCSYSLEGQIYYVVVNGQNGRVTGDRPYSGIAKLVQYGLQSVHMLEALFWGDSTKKENTSS